MLLLVKQEFGIELPIRTIKANTSRGGFTPQKPITRAYEQRPEAVKARLDEQYPAIAGTRPGAKMQRSTGAMKQRWSTRTCAVVATSPKGRPRWPTPWVARATSCR